MAGRERGIYSLPGFIYLTENEHLYTRIMKYRNSLLIVLLSVCWINSSWAEENRTIALWLFDEQIGIYPSCVLSDESDNDYPMVIGPGGQIVEGKYGQALEAIPQPAIEYPEGDEWFGLKQLEIPEGRTVEPMSWMNSNFCGLMTSSETHLRKQAGFPQATRTRLNLGAYDWTVEFWYLPTRKAEAEGVVFEIGTGPRGENEKVTRLVTNRSLDGFVLENDPGGISLAIPSDKSALRPGSRAWRHLAFVYDAEEKQLRHYVDGVLQTLPQEAAIKSLDFGDEDYFSVGRNGTWGNPLPGRLDELRFSLGRVYEDNFKPPSSFSPIVQKSGRKISLVAGPPLLFAKGGSTQKVLQLGGRKHLFIDDALVEKMDGIHFQVNPPRLAERVIDGIEGPFRKHLTVVEDEDGLIRIYNSVADDFLAVQTSRDGINWTMPDMGKGEYKGHRNIVLHEMVGGLGNPFIDPNGPPESRWKYISGYHRRGIFVYESPDGYSWRRNRTAVLPFRSGTQSCTFYDDQRQLYVGYHRTGINKTIAGATQRESIITETEDLYTPWPFKRVSQKETWEAAKTSRIRDPMPWYLDNGPLTLGGLGLEFPHAFAPKDGVDPAGVDIYITKAMKYPWAADTYLAFPIVYFHYELDGPKGRQVLMDPERGRGSGPVETQISVSRDGVNWQRHPRPAYVGIGLHQGRDIHQAYTAHGMIRRGDEIWQYYYGEEVYHSTYRKGHEQSAVYRLVQRLDGFVSADSPYDKEAILITRPLKFEGNRLVLNIDTEAAGYAQVGFLDENGQPMEGFSVDECLYINGDFIETEVEWLPNGTDVSGLQGKTVQIVFRMRGSKLYAMQFID